jgi:hypothetical protein
MHLIDRCSPMALHEFDDFAVEFACLVRIVASWAKRFAALPRTAFT